MKNEEVNTLAHWAYVKYHSRLGFLLRHSFECSSLIEFSRKFFAYIDMVFFQERIARPVRRFVAYSENWLKVFSVRRQFLKGK